MKEKGKLTEAAILEFAKTDRYADLLASLSVMCGAPMALIEALLRSDHREGWLVPCKVAGLDWSTVRAILASRYIARPVADQTLDAARSDYSKLSQAGAGRILRFWQVRQTASKDELQIQLKRPPAPVAPVNV